MLDQINMNEGPEANLDVRDLVRQAIEEFVRAENRKAEPAYKAELYEEKRRREQLEARLNELVEENRRARAMAEEADRSSQIRSELQRLGVTKVDLAFRAVKDDIARSEDGRLTAKGSEGKSLSD
jgi:predicted transcriptional regulator YheO